MTPMALRALAVLIAVAGVIDPAIARRVPAPLAVEVNLPPPSHPSFEAAEARRQALVAALGDGVVLDSDAPARAVIAIGDAKVRPRPGTPVFTLPLDDEAPGIRFHRIDVPAWTPPGQAVRLTARVAARGLAGRTTDISVRLSGAVVARLRHTWTNGEQVFDASLTLAPPAAGAHRVRVVASGPDHAEAVADALVNVRDEPLRLLIYDPRPTWPVTFVRRSLEADEMFEVAATSRSSLPVATTSGAAPATLASMNPQRYDAVLVGALDDLRSDDLRALDRFASERGGSVILLPDRRMPDAVRRQFGLPADEEVLLDTPALVEGGVSPVRASELLLLAPAGSATEIAALPVAGGRRPAVIALQHGEGQVIVSGLLDGYRYRGDDGFDPFWRALAADAAMAARPSIDLRLEPAVARPGDRVRVRVALDGGLVPPGTGNADVGGVAATLTSMAGETEPIRLWPGPRIGEFVAELPSPSAGAYVVGVTTRGASADVPLLVAEDVVQAASGDRRALEHLAAATGGGILADPAEIKGALAGIEAGERATEVRPMRSPWWIAPFALLLGVEWALRRREGLK